MMSALLNTCLNPNLEVDINKDSNAERLPLLYTCQSVVTNRMHEFHWMGRMDGWKAGLKKTILYEP